MNPTSRHPRSVVASRCTRRSDGELKRWLGWLTLPLAAALFATQAHSATLTVQANVVDSCTLNDDTLSFSESYVSGQQADVNSSVNVTVSCTNGLTVDIKLGPGNGDDGTNRGMTNGTDVLRYNLYQDSGRTEVWGDGTFGTAKRVGPWDDTSHRTQAIFGTIFGGQNVSGGAFTDQVALTVEVVPSP